MHGWDPALPSMHALFMIAGPGIPAGVVVPQVHNVDVYPLMTELLGLREARDIAGQRSRILGEIKAGSPCRQTRDHLSVKSKPRPAGRV